MAFDLYWQSAVAGPPRSMRSHKLTVGALDPVALVAGSDHPPRWFLSTDKGKVFKEAFRVLKSGGRIAISDIVATAPLPDEVKQDLALYTGCMAGAAPIREVETFLREAGFAQIKVRPKEERKAFVRDRTPDQGMQEYVVSATIEAVKP
jgi:arsenite methyltransferase